MVPSSTNTGPRFTQPSTVCAADLDPLRRFVEQAARDQVAGQFLPVEHRQLGALRHLADGGAGGVWIGVDGGRLAGDRRRIGAGRVLDKDRAALRPAFDRLALGINAFDLEPELRLAEQAARRAARFRADHGQRGDERPALQRSRDGRIVRRFRVQRQYLAVAPEGQFNRFDHRPTKKDQ
jgi:hypothetical protein